MRPSALPVPPGSLALAAILALAAAVRFWGLDFGLPHTQARPDETQIIEVTRKLLSGDLKPNFFDYPWLYMWVSTGLYLCYSFVGILAGWFSSVADFVASWPYAWEPYFLINRALSATLGSVTVLAVYGVGRRLWDQRTALVAAFFMALAFIHVRDSHFGSTDTMMTLLIVLSTMWLVDGHLTGSRRSFVLAGIMGGLATATKYNAGVIMFPVLVSQVVQVVESRRRDRGRSGGQARWAFDGRMFWFGLPCAAAFMIGVPFLIFDYADFRAAMVLLDESMRGGTGTVSSTLGNGWLHHLRYSLYGGVGAPLLIASVVGAIWMVRRRTGLALVLLAFPVIYFVVIGSVRNLFFRYAIPIVPFLCLLGAWGLVEMVNLYVNATARSAKRAAVMTWVFAFMIMLKPAVDVMQFNIIASRIDNRVVVARWFDEHVPAGASIAQSGSEYGYVQFTPGRFSPWLWQSRQFVTVDRATRARRPAIGKPDYIVVQESPLPNTTQELVKNWLSEGYAPVSKFKATSLYDRNVYDLQDAFFIPFGASTGVTRPGPNFTVYKHVGQ